MVRLAIDAEGVLALQTEEVFRLVFAEADLTESTRSLVDGIRHPIHIILIKVLREET